MLKCIISLLLTLWFSFWCLCCDSKHCCVHLRHIVQLFSLYRWQESHTWLSSISFLVFFFFSDMYMSQETFKRLNLTKQAQIWLWIRDVRNELDLAYFSHAFSFFFQYSNSETIKEHQEPCSNDNSCMCSFLDTNWISVLELCNTEFRQSAETPQPDFLL